MWHQFGNLLGPGRTLALWCNIARVKSQYFIFQIDIQPYIYISSFLCFYSVFIVPSVYSTEMVSFSQAPDLLTYLQSCQGKHPYSYTSSKKNLHTFFFFFLFFVYTRRKKSIQKNIKTRNPYIRYNKYYKLLLADLGNASGCSTNSILID